MTAPAALADAAVAAAYDRRRRHGNPDDLERFPDPGDLLGVVTYLSRYQRAPADVLATDALDQLRILDHLMGEIDRRRLAAMRAARRRGLTWQEIAAAMGLRSRQGAESLFMRLAWAGEACGHVKTERPAREARRHARIVATVPVGTARDARLRAFVDELLDHATALPEDAVDDLRYLRGELDRHRPGGGSLPPSAEAHIRVALIEIREAGVPTALLSAIDRAVSNLGL